MIWYILLLIFFAVFYLLIKVCVKPRLAMKKYNGIKGVVVYPFVPLFGLFGQMQNLLEKTGDAYYYRKHVARDNPQMKALVTNLMGQVLILITDPQLLKIYFTNQQRYIKEDFFIDNRRRFFGNGLALLQGQKWAKARKNWGQVFHFEFLNKNIYKIKKIIHKQLQQAKINQMKINAINFGASIAGVAVIQSFFALEGDEKIQNKNIGAWIYKLISDGTGAQESLRHLFFGRKGLQFGLFEIDRDVKRRLKIYRAWAKQQILKKIEQNQQPNSNIIQILKDSNLVNTQQGFSTDQILQQFITFFAAGTDTTAHLICMCLYYLAKYPQYQDELRKQLSKYSEAPTKIQEYNKFKYLDAIIMQTFRHYAYIDSTFLRVSLVDHYLGQIPVPKGTLIGPGWHQNNYNPQIFDDVEKYNPDRWISPQKYKKLHPYSFTPFSAGPRSCIGQTFALLSVKILLWELVSGFELKLQKDTQLRFKFRSLYEPIDPVIIVLNQLK